MNNTCSINNIPTSHTDYLSIPFRAERSGLQSILGVENLSKTFSQKTVFRDISFRLSKGGSLGIVGESGGGKSTLARCLARLEEPTTGKIIFCDENFTNLTGRKLRQVRQKMQLIFQEAIVALNSKMSIARSLSEAIRARRESGDNETSPEMLLQLVNLEPELLKRYPAELSGGQLQRVAIARALAVQPYLLLADEPTSPLDTISRRSLIELLDRLRRSQNLSLIFISHDIRAVAELCDEIMVLHRGRQIEYGPTPEILRQPRHAWTQRLIETANLQRWTRRVGESTHLIGSFIFYLF